MWNTERAWIFKAMPYKWFLELNLVVRGQQLCTQVHGFNAQRTEFFLTHDYDGYISRLCFGKCWPLHIYHAYILLFSPKVSSMNKQLGHTILLRSFKYTPLSPMINFTMLPLRQLNLFKTINNFITWHISNLQYHNTLSQDSAVDKHSRHGATTLHMYAFYA